MLKKIACLVLVLALIAVAGCSLGKPATTSATTSPAAVTSVREATIAKVWSMKQLQIDVTKSLNLVLVLKDGDKVDGFFYTLKGDLTSFTVSGSSQIYASKPSNSETSLINSDRFSFAASTAQGIAYTLTITAPSSATSKTTLFLELIYPSTGSLNVPLGTK
ncbi:MAG TPA: hypothetical protein VMB24_03955 [Dehalococcoidales bacterium]|nr:hypothetical protein [Dehalococcoidales bacterium]